MDNPVPMDHPEQQSFWRRRRNVLLIGGLGAAVLCVAAVCLFTLLFASGVTPIRAQLARQAIANPSSATLHLGPGGDISKWVTAGANDFAVNNGMVIFPEPNNVSALVDRAQMRDLKRPALVYAPDGSDLSMLPGMPDDRQYLYGGEWRLLRCRPEGTQAFWWECLLVVGSSI